MVLGLPCLSKGCRCMEERAYPIAPLGADGNDHRFTFGFVHDVGKVFEEHGYPSIGQRWGDHLELQQALYRFIYLGDERAVS